MKINSINQAFVFLAAVTLLANLSSCKTHTAVEDSRQGYIIPDSIFNTLHIDTAKISRVTDDLKFNGVVDFNTDKVVNVFPLVSGNLQGVHVMLGDYVHAGETLGIVRSAEIANFNSALISAEATVRSTARQLDQQRALFKSGLASRVDVSGAEATYQQAVAAKVAAERVLSVNGNSTNGQFVIKSPISGFVVSKSVTNGMAIRSDNNTGLFTISDLKNVWVQANVYEENIGKVHQGDEAQVTTISYPEKIFKGRVDRLMNVLDPTSKVMKMRIVLDNPKYELKPQMFATVFLKQEERQQAVAISSKALIFDHSQYYVIVVTGKKDIKLRPVEIIGGDSNVTFIKSGVSAGDRLIASQALLIYGSLNS